MAYELSGPANIAGGSQPGEEGGEPGHSSSDVGLFAIGPGDEMTLVLAGSPLPLGESLIAALCDDSRPVLASALRKHRASGSGNVLTLLVPPRAAPELDIRRDGPVAAFLASGSWSTAVLEWASLPPAERCFRALSAVINGDYRSIHLNIVAEAGETPPATVRDDCSVEMMVPHRGSNRHLRMALESLARQTYAGRTIVCFDQPPDPELCEELSNETLELYEIMPSPAGPYVPRQHFGLSSSARYMVFQDSDDFSLRERVETLVAFAQRHDADIVGCQELQCNELTRTVEVIRYPLDVNRALEAASGAVQLFPTTITRVDCLRRLGGFSTNRTFGADRQFQLRAHRDARMMNVDAFLYVRRLRKGSLTTSPATGMGAPIRQEINRRWKEAFDAIREGSGGTADAALQPEHTSQDFTIRNVRTNIRSTAVLRPDPTGADGAASH